MRMAPRSFQAHLHGNGQCQLENQLQAELYLASRAASDHGAARHYVRSSFRCPEHTWRIRAGVRLPRTRNIVLPSVEEIEEFRTKLRGDPLGELPILSQRHVPDANALAAKHVPAHVSESALGWCNDRGIAGRVAAEFDQRG